MPGRAAAVDQAILAPGLVCTIPPPAAANQNVSAAQTIVAQFRGQTFAFQAQLQMTPAEFDFVALDNFGRRALTAKWTGSYLVLTRAPWLPALIRAADILTDVAIVYWPESRLASDLSACGARLGENSEFRFVSAQARDVMTVHYGSGEGWNRSATLRNLAFGFTIDIQSVELAQ
ncbi:MAG TPA: DUF3261 domain-containing protein [Rhizomicrobium sp.]|nr:DUF3261 domain-containing protein [Rhizomicrobium sp.]